MSNPSIKRVATKDTPQTKNHYAQAVIHNGIVYGSGNICMDPKTMAFPVGETVQDQARLVLSNIDATLKAAGSSRNSVLKMNCYLSNFKRDFRAFEEVYHEFFGDHYPARINIEIPNLPGGSLIECDFIAAVETEK